MDENLKYLMQLYHLESDSKYTVFPLLVGSAKQLEDYAAMNHPDLDVINLKGKLGPYDPSWLSSGDHLVTSIVKVLPGEKGA